MILNGDPMNATSQPDAAVAGGSDLIGELDATELAEFAGAGGKKLFCRLPLPVKLALLARVTGRRTDGSRSAASTPASHRRR